jgi:NAD-dependent dihydropyrimidine dehydrogenase PreA subunit
MGTPFNGLLNGRVAATTSHPVKIDNELYVRDYSKCVLCYKCVDALRIPVAAPVVKCFGHIG